MKKSTAMSLLLMNFFAMGMQRYEDRYPLHTAAGWGSCNQMQASLSEGINAKDKYKRTPLMMAVMCRNASTVENLLEYNADMSAIDMHKKTVFEYALFPPCPVILSLLIDHGAMEKMILCKYERTVDRALDNGVKAPIHMVRNCPWLQQLLVQKINKIMNMLVLINRRALQDGVTDGIGAIDLRPEIAREIARHMYLKGYNSQ